MTDKEKARAYDEALKIAKNYYSTTDSVADTELIELIFPELKKSESEDEKIRNRLIHIVNGCLGVAVPEPEKSQLIVWLEKQNSNVDNANKEYWRGYREGKQEILDKYAELEKQGEIVDINPSEFDLRLNKLLKQFETLPKEELVNCLSFYLNTVQNDGIYVPEEKQGKKESNKMPIWKHWKDGICGNWGGKQIYLIKNEDDYVLSSCLGFECDYIELSDLDGLMLPKKQEWGEEDENKINTIIQIYRPSKKIMDWLKSLKDRVQPQPKVEWSGEDETGLANTIIMLKEGASLHFNKKDITKAVDWLKSIRNRITWKPSEEQLKSLQEVIDVGHFTSYPNVLETLYEQLKKL